MNLALLMAMAYSLMCWAKWIANYRSDLSALPSAMLPPRPRERPFWNPGDALIMMGSMQVIAGLAVGALTLSGLASRGTDTKSPEGAAYLITVTLAAGVVASLITLVWLRFRDRDAVSKLSLRLNDEDGILGLKAALMILPPVLLISAIASQLVTYEHPVLDSMAGLNDPLKFSMIFIGTAIVTPFVEEFLFRVLLQGGLERIADPIAEEGEQWRPRSYWPMVVSSLVFAMMHLGQGAAPIPLFFLSLGLGYLYRQTGNITAPMIVHMVLNGTTILMEGIRVMG
ncbi:CPBP family intramembrane glutamic endopeptidase [Rubripirellula tenax]|nr:type II CAAX endopeptidase family protein [Rubripirellula tenax]